MKSKYLPNLLLLVPLASLVLGACGSGGGDGPSSSPSPPPPRNSSPGGIWKGSASSGQTILGIVTEAGEFTFIQDDGVQYFCNMSVSQTAVSAGFTGITQHGTTFPDGATSGGGTLNGIVAERNSLSGSINFSTSGNPGPGSRKADLSDGSDSHVPRPCASSSPGVSANEAGALKVARSAKLSVFDPVASANAPTPAGGEFTLKYDALYDRDSSLATIAGNFRAADGTIVSVDANGNIFSQDATTGCVVNGRVLLIDANYNVYRIEYAFGSCTGDLTVLNGATFDGLGTLDNTVVPEQAIFAVRYQSDAMASGLVEVLDRA